MLKIRRHTTQKNEMLLDRAQRSVGICERNQKVCHGRPRCVAYYRDVIDLAGTTWKDNNAQMHMCARYKNETNTNAKQRRDEHMNRTDAQDLSKPHRRCNFQEIDRYNKQEKKNVKKITTYGLSVFCTYHVQILFGCILWGINLHCNISL